jgi:hypothetical protein
VRELLYRMAVTNNKQYEYGFIIYTRTICIQQGIFIFIKPENQIRIDRIITLFGKVGAAYDEYDSFANQCLSCTGGYDL